MARAEGIRWVLGLTASIVLGIALEIGLLVCAGLVARELGARPRSGVIVFFVVQALAIGLWILPAMIRGRR